MLMSIMRKLISIMKLVVKKRPRSGAEGVNEVEPVIGRRVTLSRPLTGTRLIHLNGHWRPIQTAAISNAGCPSANKKIMCSLPRDSAAEGLPGSSVGSHGSRLSRISALKCQDQVKGLDPKTKRFQLRDARLVIFSLTHHY